MRKKRIALLLCLCVLWTTVVCTAGTANAAAQSQTRIGDVVFTGDSHLQSIDFSAVIRDTSTVTGRTLHLCRVYDEDLSRMDWDRVANFVFSDSQTGVAELDDYPDADAKIEPGQYLLLPTEGNLFDDVPYYLFSAAEYYRNMQPGTFGVRLNAVGLPAFDDYTVTKAEGETVYEMQMTLSAELAAFYDAWDPDAEIAITCKYGYGVEDVIARICAKPVAYDADSGVLTIALGQPDGTAGTNLHNFRVDADDYGYIFEFEYFSGLFRCGAAKSAYAYRQLSGKSIAGLPQRVFTKDTKAGRLFDRLYGATWSDKPAKRRAAALTLVCLSLPLFAGFARAVFDSVRAMDNNIADSAREILLQRLHERFG